MTATLHEGVSCHEMPQGGQLPQILISTPPSTSRELDVQGRPLGVSHAQIVGILRNRLGANHAELLASPRAQADGSVTWSTSLPGPVVRATDLPTEERAALEKRAARFAEDIGNLVRQLRAEGSITSHIVARTLELALLQPPGDWLFSVDGRPVRVLWGHSDEPPPPDVPRPDGPATAAAMPTGASAAVAGSPQPASATAAAAAAPAVTASSVQAAASDAAASRWWPWAALALLLLLGGAAAWLALNALPAGDDTADQIAAAQARVKTLEDQLAQGAGRLPRLQCVPDPPEPSASAPAPEPPASAPPPAASAPASTPPPPAPVAASKPEVKPPPPPSPVDALKKKVADAGQDCNKLASLLRSDPLLERNDPEAHGIRMQMLQTMQQQCREKAIQEARNACPGQRPPELAPEMALVFDASGSMDFSLDLTPEEMRQAREADAAQKFAGALGALFGLPVPNRTPAAVERIYREPKRITVARRSALDVVRRVPADMGVGLVLVDQCPAARSVGMFSPGQRADLLERIEGIKPRAGTPLADGVARAGQLVDGTTREAIIVVVSDGEESCGQDPCAVAAELKRAKPYVKINVVDITGTGAGNCLAQISGGKVYTANSADDVVAMTERAARDAMAPANCKP